MSEFEHLDEEEKRKLVLDCWNQGKDAIDFIRKDHANVQENYSKENRDFIKLELSTVPIIIGLIFGFGFNAVKNDVIVKISIILLFITWVIEMSYYFLILNKRQINLFNAFKKIEKSSQECLDIEKAYLLGKKEFTDVEKAWDKLKKSKIKEIEKLVIDRNLIYIQIPYIIAIILIIISILK